MIHASGEWEGIILFGLYTGQRLKDIARLTCHNIDTENEELRFVTAKTGRRMSIPLAAPLLALDSAHSQQYFVPLAAPHGDQMLKNAGVPKAVAMDIIGHDSEVISRHYTHIESNAKRAALRKLPDLE